MTRANRWIGSLLVLVLAAAACGERDPVDPGAFGGQGAAPAETGGSTEASGDFGDLAGVCGPTEGGGTTVTDAAEAQGVDDDSIRVGTVADPGFEGTPGLNQEIFDAAEAFVGWCNEAGGVNGRQIELTLRDAAINEYQPQLERACSEDFALVGSGAVQDNLWPEVGASCGLIDIAAFSVTPDKAGATGRDPIEARSIQPVPNPNDALPVGSNRILADESADVAAAADRSALVFADFQTLIDQADKVRAGWEAAGHTFVHEDVYNVLGEANWSPFAAALREADVEYLSFVGTGDNLALLQQAMVEIDYSPVVTLQEANFYDQAYLDAAGAAAEGTYVRSASWPFEEADDNPATRQYIDLVEAQGGKVALLGVQAFSAWLMFATSVAECDRADDLTRTCVLEAAADSEGWTGGGLHSPTSPAANEMPPCRVLLRVEGGEFVRHAPTDEDYACSEDSIVGL